MKHKIFKFSITARAYAEERREEPKISNHMKPQDFTRGTQDIKKLKRKILCQSCVNLWLNGFNTIPLRTLRPLRFIGFVCILVFFCVFAGFCDFAVSTAEAKDMKIGYVSIAKVFDEYEKTRESDKELEKKSQAKQLDREKYVTEIKKMKDETDLLNEKAKEAKQKEIDAKMDALQKFDKETRDDLMRERDMMAREILKDIDESVKEIGKADSFTLLFDDRALLYSGQELDITDKVLNTLNTRYNKSKKIKE